MYVGLGATLSQLGDDDNQHPIAYAGRKLKPRETRYSTTEKECLAVVCALKFFEHYLYGQLFTAVTDHRPLTWLSNMKKANPGSPDGWSLDSNITLPPNINPAASIRMRTLCPEDLPMPKPFRRDKCHNRASRPDSEHTITEQYPNCVNYMVTRTISYIPYIVSGVGSILIWCHMAVCSLYI